MKVISKSFLTLSFLTLFVFFSQIQISHQQAQCLYCKRADSQAYILESYSYCHEREFCLRDQWLYFNQGCGTRWTVARRVPLSDCNATVVNTCNWFVSKPEASGLWTNHTQTLERGQQCNVQVDATDWVGRVVFDNNQLLGVDVGGYDIGDVLTVERGQTKNFTIYNGDLTNTISFIIAFSGAQEIITKSAFFVFTVLALLQ